MEQRTLFVALTALFVLRLFLTRPAYEEGQKIRITGKVLEDPIKSGSYQTFSLAGLTVYLPAYPEISYGDLIKVEGDVGGKNLENPKLIEASENKNSLTKARSRIVDFYKSSLPTPHSDLIAGITLGIKSNLSKSFWESLKKTGTAHVVVASGMNVTFVAGFLMSTLFLFMKRRAAIIFALVGVWVYAALSGFDAPMVRAAIMGSVVFSAQELGRLINAYKALFLTGLMMLIIVPQWLTDIGFILSFVATLSLMLFAKTVERYFLWLPKIFSEGLVTSLAAQIGVAPILFITFGQFNILSPVINALVLWSVAPIMIVGAISGIMGLVFEPLGRLVLYLAYPLTNWFVFIVQLFG